MSRRVKLKDFFTKCCYTCAYARSINEPYGPKPGGGMIWCGRNAPAKSESGGLSGLPRMTETDLCGEYAVNWDFEPAYWSVGELEDPGKTERAMAGDTITLQKDTH